VVVVAVGVVVIVDGGGGIVWDGGGQMQVWGVKHGYSRVVEPAGCGGYMGARAVVVVVVDLERVCGCYLVSITL
jgi:hypothetical protein